MKQLKKSSYLMAGLLVVLAVVLYSCGGGGGGYGGGGGGGSVAAPSMLALTSPADKVMNVGTTPTLTWTQSAGATGYRVQVDTTGTFTGVLVINVLEGPTTYSYTVLTTDNLVIGTLYYWRVVAENTYGQSTAGPRTFTP